MSRLWFIRTVGNKYYSNVLQKLREQTNTKCPDAVQSLMQEPATMGISPRMY